MNTTLMTITPELATAWLSTNNKNRPLRTARVKQYAGDMMADRWKITHQGLAFYDDGLLADGQHRLAAIVKANKAVQMYVTTGLQREIASAIDAGKPREICDVLHIINGMDWVSKEIVAVARVALTRFESDPRSVSGFAVREFLERHSDALRFVVDITKNRKRNLTISVIQAAYLCAILAGENRAAIARFADIMYNGEIAGPHENAAIRVREMMLSDQRITKADRVKRIQKGIYSFCRGTQIKRLICPETYLYPMPE